MKTFVVAGVLLALLTGCGFHLEGRTPLPESMKTAYVQATDLQTDFAQSLRKALLTSGARPPDDKRSASSVVYIIKDDVVHRTLSVLAPQDISATRSYSFDETRLLAKEHEEAILRQAMAHDLADRVIRQLSSL
jgi:LPS-assembly lipoprotein